MFNGSDWTVLQVAALNDVCETRITAALQQEPSHTRSQPPPQLASLTVGVLHVTAALTVGFLVDWRYASRRILGSDWGLATWTLSALVLSVVSGATSLVA